MNCLSDPFIPPAFLSSVAHCSSPQGWCSFATVQWAFAKSAEIKRVPATPTPSPVDLMLHVGVLVALLPCPWGSEWFWREECGLYVYVCVLQSAMSLHVCEYIPMHIYMCAHAFVISALCPLKLVRHAS